MHPAKHADAPKSPSGQACSGHDMHPAEHADALKIPSGQACSGHDMHPAKHADAPKIPSSQACGGHDMHPAKHADAPRIPSGQACSGHNMHPAKHAGAPIISFGQANVVLPKHAAGQTSTSPMPGLACASQAREKRATPGAPHSICPSRLALPVHAKHGQTWRTAPRSVDAGAACAAGASTAARKAARGGTLRLRLAADSVRCKQAALNQHGHS